MTTRPSYLSTTPDDPPPEDYSWLPNQHPTFAPSPFLGPEQSLLPVPESPSSQFASLATQDENMLHANTMFSSPSIPKDHSKRD